MDVAWFYVYVYCVKMEAFNNYEGNQPELLVYFSL